MKTKILKYGAYPRHNQVVTAHADVTFLNEYVGYSECDKCDYNPDFDHLNVILRVGKVAFEAETVCRIDMMNKTYLPMMTERAKNLQGYVQDLMNKNLYVCLLYISVFMYLGWDSTPLREYRDDYIYRMNEKARREHEERERLKDEEKRIHNEEWNRRLTEGEESFANDDYIANEVFIGLCERAGINIHPRTKGTLKYYVTDVSRKRIKFLPRFDNSTPCLDGCFKLVEQLISYYDASKLSSNT